MTRRFAVVLIVLLLALVVVLLCSYPPCDSWRSGIGCVRRPAMREFFRKLWETKDFMTYNENNIMLRGVA